MWWRRFGNGSGKEEQWTGCGGGVRGGGDMAASLRRRRRGSGWWWRRGFTAVWEEVVAGLALRWRVMVVRSCGEG